MIYILLIIGGIGKYFFGFKISIIYDIILFADKRRKIMKYKKIIAYIVCLIMFVSLMTVGTSTNTLEVKAKSMHDKKACWVSYQDIHNELRDKSEADFRKAVTRIYDNILNNRMNTVIMHVRAMGDAMYPSSYYPWSTYITSSRKNPGYDPLKIMVEIAHQKGLKIEAWINPYRISLSDTTTNSFKGTSYYSKYKSFIMEYKNSGGQTCMVLDPARQESRDLITNGVKEIVSNYDVDAIHFDDYFYVDGMVDGLPQSERMSNVNKLVKQVYSSIKSINPNCEFGISPAGNLSNARAQGADIDRWMSEEGYVDYIMPQIYWSDVYSTSAGIQTMYTDRCNAWQAINIGDIPIYVGLALYRVGTESTVDMGWAQSNNNLAKQYEIAYEMGYDGYALFRYEWLNKNIAKTELSKLNNYVDLLDGKYPTNPDSYVSYVTHVQSYGWQTSKIDGVLSGTTGEGKRLEAISISLGDKAGEGGITYRTHCQSYGWRPWVSDGELSGTMGESKRMEAIQIKLTGAAAEKYDVYYRVHAQSYGWLDWAKNGEAAGTATYGKRLEAIQIVLVEKDGEAPGETMEPYVTRNVSYTTHVQTYGWLEPVYDGQGSGSTGQAKRLEGIKINLTDNLYLGNIEYRTHCQTHGWLDWVTNGTMSGTSGQAKRLEAIQIRLTGEISNYYDVYYRVHCQTYGWMDWVKNGEVAGTSGEAKRLEAIEIKLVPKN